MATINEFENLEIWQLAREQCKLAACHLKSFMIRKEFELVSQIKRSSGSVMDNIAEGFDRGGTAEFIFFLGISKGSNAELRSQFYRSLDLDLITIADFNNFAERNKTISRKLSSFIQYLKSTDIKGIKYRK